MRKACPARFFVGSDPMVVEGEVDLDEAVGEPFIRAGEPGESKASLFYPR